MQDMEQQIRERAYYLWVADGYPDGNADKHWLAAQREVLAASLSDIGRVSMSAAELATRPAGKKINAKAKTKRRAA